MRNRYGVPLSRMRVFTLQSPRIHVNYIFCDAQSRNGKSHGLILIKKLTGVRAWQKQLPAIFWLVMNRPVWT